jgi:hypothetical protein
VTSASKDSPSPRRARSTSAAAPGRRVRRDRPRRTWSSRYHRRLRLRLRRIAAPCASTGDAGSRHLTISNTITGGGICGESSAAASAAPSVHRRSVAVNSPGKPDARAPRVDRSASTSANADPGDDRRAHQRDNTEGSVLITYRRRNRPYNSALVARRRPDALAAPPSSAGRLPDALPGAQRRHQSPRPATSPARR